MSAGCMNPTGPLVQLVTGSKKQIILAHKELLAKHSPFFENAFLGPWKEATSSIIELPDSEPIIVNTFLEWAYTQKFIGPHLALELYILSDKYQISFLETESLKALFGHWTKWNKSAKKYDIVPESLPTAEAIHHALDHLPTTSKLLEMMRAIQGNLKAYTPTRCNWPTIKEARSRLFKEIPYKGTKINDFSHYCNHGRAQKMHWSPARCGCYNCIWLREEKPWLCLDPSGMSG